MKNSTINLKNDDDLYVSQVELAKILKVSKQAISKKKYLTKFDGKYHVGFARFQLLKNIDPGQRGQSKLASDADLPDAGGRDGDVPVVPLGAGMLSFSDAKAVTENYRAKTSKLQYEELEGSLADYQGYKDMAQDWNHKLRSRLDCMPDRLSIEFSTETNPDVIYAKLVEEIGFAVEGGGDEVVSGRVAAMDMVKEEVKEDGSVG